MPSEAVTTATAELIEPSERLAQAGLDLLHPFPVSAYDRSVLGHDLLQPIGGSVRSDALALLVGNTRALWPRFAAAYSESEVLQRCPDPLDAYVEQAVIRAFAGVEPRPNIFFAHTMPVRVSMLRAAAASGFACIGPAHLAVHDTFGPWFALRALVVVDLSAPDEVSPPANPCVGCSEPCVEAMNRAMEQNATVDAQAVSASWRQWLAVREVCPVGEHAAYPPDQKRYHYTRDRAVLSVRPES